MEAIEPQSAAPESTGIDLEREVLELGRRLGRHQDLRSFVGRVAYDRGLGLIVNEPQLRAALFRLVDVAPACDSNAELAEHLDAFLGETESRTLGIALGRLAADSPIARIAVGAVAGWMIRGVSRRFIVGESITVSKESIRNLWAGGVAVTVDLLGEATVTHGEGEAYARRCAEALEVLSAAARDWPERPLLERDSLGPLPRVNLSVKVTALTPLTRPQAPERGRPDATLHLRRLFRQAKRLQAHIHIDTESVDSRELTLGLVLDLLGEEEFADGPSIGLVLQAYHCDSEELLDLILERSAASRRSVPLTVRLVKGAYWDHEMIEAAQHGWCPPVWSEKFESDRCFERLSRRLIDAHPLVRTAIASHNLRSVAYAICYADSIGMDPADLELQVLRGLGDDLQGSLVAVGRRCRTYCPVGDLVAGMAYLVRRLLENTSNGSFIDSRAGGVPLEELLREP